MFISERHLNIGSPSQIAPSESLAFYFDLNSKRIEGFVINQQGQYFAYMNRCRHMGITLDWDTHEFYTPDKESLICKTHGALYDPATGECIKGPCLGKSLHPLPISIQSDQILLDLKKTEELYSD